MPANLEHQATRTPFISRSSGRAKTDPASWMDSGERGSGPAIIDRNSARSWTFRAIGPSTPILPQALVEGTLGTRPGEVRNPTTEQKLAGFRSEPPASLPSASGNKPH